MSVGCGSSRSVSCSETPTLQKNVGVDQGLSSAVHGEECFEIFKGSALGCRRSFTQPAAPPTGREKLLTAHTHLVLSIISVMTLVYLLKSTVFPSSPPRLRICRLFFVCSAARARLQNVCASFASWFITAAPFSQRRCDEWFTFSVSHRGTGRSFHLSLFRGCSSYLISTNNFIFR